MAGLIQRSALVGLVTLVCGVSSTLLLAAACSSYGEEAVATPTDDAGGDATSSPNNDGASPDGSNVVTCTGELKPGVGPSGELTATCDGVMTDLSRSAQHCGQCGHDCGSAGGGGECVAGQCKVREIAAFSGLQEIDLIGRMEGARLVAVANRNSVVSALDDGRNPLTHFRTADAGGLLETALIGGVDDRGLFASVLSDGVYSVSANGALLLGAFGIGAKGLAPLGADRIVATVLPRYVISMSVTMKSESEISADERYPTSVLAEPDGSAVYWANTPEFAGAAGGAGEIVRYDVNTKTIVRSKPIPILSSIATDASHIYYFDGQMQEIRRLSKSDLQGSSELIATWSAERAQFATRITVSGDMLFLALAPPGSRNPKFLMRVSKCGGAPLTLWSGRGFGSFLVESNGVDVMLSPLEAAVGLTR